MKDEYLKKISATLKAARPRLAATHGLEFKNCFGAVAAYVGGRIFMSCGNFGIALRLPQKVLPALFKERGVKELRYFPKGHVKKEYAVLPKRILEDADRFKKLVGKSINYVQTLD